MNLNLVTNNVRISFIYLSKQTNVRHFVQGYDIDHLAAMRMKPNNLTTPRSYCENTVPKNQLQTESSTNLLSS